MRCIDIKSRPDACAVMRCPPRALNMVINPVHGQRRWVLAASSMQPHVCLAENSPLTNRISRHFARIKAAPGHRGQSWLLCADRAKSGHFASESQETSKRKLRRRRRRRSGHFEGESQETSKWTLRTRRARRPGRPCRPPCRCRLRHDRGGGAPFPPRPLARHCDRPAGPSALRN